MQNPVKEFFQSRRAKVIVPITPRDGTVFSIRKEEQLCI
jgi:hypothetical protein